MPFGIPQQPKPSGSEGGSEDGDEVKMEVTL